jgi:hypothetical protein
MHISSLSANLISDYCMQSDNVIFDMTDCTLHYNNNIIEHALEVNRLFQLHLNDSSQFYTFAASRGFKISFKIWHHHLGHLNHANIEHLTRMTDSMNLTDLLCLYCENTYKACMKVKQTHCSYDTLIKSVTQILSFIHSDIVSLIISIVWQFKVLYYSYWWLYQVHLNVSYEEKKQTAKHIKALLSLWKFIFWIFLSVISVLIINTNILTLKLI